MALTDQDHAKILNYWTKRKQGLSTQEQEEFYRLLFPLLMRTQLPPEFADQEARRNLVHMFFADKILINATTSAAGPLASAYVLHGYLKNYALDLLRQDCRQGYYDDNHAHGDDDSDEEPCPVRYGAESLALDHSQLLAEAGIDLHEAIHSADCFLSSLEIGERCYLSRNTCADAEEQEAISALASRLQLGSSYHYKARQLGITGSKGGFFKGYEATKLGQWLTSVGAQISQDWQEELNILLTLLCLRVHALKDSE